MRSHEFSWTQHWRIHADRELLAGGTRVTNQFRPAYALPIASVSGLWVATPDCNVVILQAELKPEISIGEVDQDDGVGNQVLDVLAMHQK